uniref:L-Fucosyltransferase n=1 Tax=Ditylenchus dipsaci TaxID=166011 RepID=A0A915CPL0_9BILA
MSAMEEDLTTPTTSTTNTSEEDMEAKQVQETSKKVITDENLKVEQTTDKAEDISEQDLKSTEEGMETTEEGERKVTELEQTPEKIWKPLSLLMKSTTELKENSEEDLKTEEVDQETAYSPVFVSAKLQKIHEFTYLLTQQEGWSAGELYSFYFPKTSIAEAVHSEYVKCEEDKQACKTMLDKLHTYVAVKLDAVLEDFSAIRDNSTDADHIIGHVKMAVDVHKAVSLEELAIDASAMATCIDKFQQLVGQLSHSSALNKSQFNRSWSYYEFCEHGDSTGIRGLQPNIPESSGWAGVSHSTSGHAHQRTCAFVVRLAFTHVKDHQAAMTNFYEREALKNQDENAPNFRKYYKHFDTEMTQILNGITDYDSFCLASSLEKNNRAVRKLGFLLMIAPQPAIRQVLLICVKSKPLVSSVLWLLGRLQPVFQLRVMPTQFQSKEMELFVITQFRRFLGGEESIDMVNEQDRSNIEYLLLLLTKTQFKEKEALAERIISQHPYFEATELLKDFIADNLTRSFHVDFTLTVLYKMLQSYGGKEWIIQWAKYDFCNESFEGVDPTILISLLVDVYKIENGNSKIQKAIVSIFRSLGSKLKADQVQIQHCAFVLHKLNIFDWCQKYFICHSMCDVLVNYKPEIPSVLYNALSDAAKQNFQTILRPVECSEVEDFTKSIFELAMVSADCALELIKCGFEHPPANIDRVVLADALLCSVRTDTSTKSVQKLMPVVGGLLDLLAGPATQFSTLGGVQQAGAKQLRIIEIFFKAVKLYIINNLEGDDKLSENRFGEEASVILQSFCENTLHWLSNDLALLKDRKLVIQVLSDLQKLIFNINFLDRRLCSLPICVKNVRKEILAFFSHLYKEFFGSSFDAVQENSSGLENQPPASTNGTNARQIFSNVNNLVVGTNPQRSFQNNRRQGNQRKPVSAPTNSDWRQTPEVKRGDGQTQHDADKVDQNNGDARKPSKYNKNKNKKRYSNKPEGDESLQFDQPWRISPAKIYSNLQELEPSQLYIFGNFSYSPGLGNLMFQYAALRVLAYKYNALVVLPSNCLLRKAFGGLDRTLFMAPSSLHKTLYLHRGRLKEIRILNKTWSLYQQQLINDQFTLLPALVEAAQQNLEEARLERIQIDVESKPHQTKENGVLVEEENDVAINLPGDFSDTYTFIGIHARHGVDITLNSRNLRHGHTTAPIDYYTKAMNYYKTLFPDQKLIFVVSSDDINWARRNIVSKTKGEVFYLRSKHREIDLATLVQCNHTIISTGTFSWWTAYLNAGKTVRYAGWPRPTLSWLKWSKSSNISCQNG